MQLADRTVIRVESALWLACQKLEKLTGQTAEDWYDELVEEAETNYLSETEND